ncbi:TlpA disulfide reductase family protein [Ideonella livida]|uniref:TlpA family protein disulfide reductase n=1 Tax=Ideonella livida TaxID=2707176 RepID=A0A7C9TL51_9BURK|nr:TlpA disulfide reductase family protein [Ideonella livida]NDY93279.1 TlpA family protein disulfide reductase [Ideonella livida]
MSPERRVWLGAGVGAAVLGGVTWRLLGPSPSPTPQDDPQARLWQLPLTDPQGRPLSLAPLRGRPLVVNFWAAWCAPCVREMPLLDRFAQAHRAAGWEVLGLALDKPEAVQAFLARTPVGFPVGMLGLDQMGWLRELGNPAGALPYTLLLDARGHVRQRKLGELDEALLGRWREG